MIALEWIGAIFGLAGAWLVASHCTWSRYGWWAFLVANVALIGFALGGGHYGLLVQQVGFMGSSVLGLCRARAAARRAAE